MCYAAVVLASLAHNGVVHEPLGSSSILIGPSLADGVPYVIYNYGMNYVKGYDFNTSWFPTAALAVTSTTAFTVSDVGYGFRYTLGTALIDTPSGCPEPRVSKFVSSANAAAEAASLFALDTGDIYDVTYTNETINCAKRTSWPSGIVDWPSPWGPVEGNTESPSFFSYAEHDSCKWYSLPFVVDATANVYGNTTDEYNVLMAQRSTELYSHLKAYEAVELKDDGHIDASLPVPDGGITTPPNATFKNITLYHTMVPDIGGMPFPTPQVLLPWVANPTPVTTATVSYRESYDMPEIAEVFNGLDKGAEYRLRITLSDLDNFGSSYGFYTDPGHTVPFLETVRIFINGAYSGTMTALKEGGLVHSVFDCRSSSSGRIEVMIAQAFRYPYMHNADHVNFSFTGNQYYAVQLLGIQAKTSYYQSQAGIRVEKMSVEPEKPLFGVKVVSFCDDISVNSNTKNLADGFSDRTMIHGGGDLFVLNDQLYLANGETNGKKLGIMVTQTDSRASDDDYVAGKVLTVASDGTVAIAARGLRHPWTVAVDGKTAYIADVGQSECEEISAFTGEKVNFGWPLFEGKSVHYPFASLSGVNDPFTFPTYEDCRYPSDFLNLGRSSDASIMTIFSICVLLLALAAAFYRRTLFAVAWVAFATLVFYPFFFRRDGAFPATILRHRPGLAYAYILVALVLALVPLLFSSSKQIGIAVVAITSVYAAVFAAVLATFPSVWNLATMPYILSVTAGVAILGGAWFLARPSHSKAYKLLLEHPSATTFY